MQKAIEDWSGVKLDLADDRTVTSDETWLLTDACRKTPLIALGNARDNRVMHALGTRYLLQSNRTWPGGDRFVIRSIFEPFAADVNYVVLEASTAAGLDGAVAKFAAMLKGLRKDETATLPRFRDIGFAKDAWGDDPSPWTPPTEYRAAGRSIPEIALAAAKSSLKLNSFETVGQLDNLLRPYVCGGRFGNGEAKLSSLPPDQVRMAAAMLLNVGRADGGRIIPVDYGATAEILAIRSLMQTGILNEKELNEFENCLVSSAAFPNYYMYDHIGSDSGYINELGGRHSASALLSTVILLDYVRTHCRMDDKTRKEIERRADGARKTTAHFVRSFRDNVDEVCLGETNMLYFYAMLHQGMPDWVRSGNLRRGGLLHHDQRQHVDQLAANPGRLRGPGLLHQRRPAWSSPVGTGGASRPPRLFTTTTPSTAGIPAARGTTSTVVWAPWAAPFCRCTGTPTDSPSSPPPLTVCAACRSTSGCTAWWSVRKRRGAGI